ncbi:hypothetical protein [Xenorhabdus bovienii]|uniref:hypothetical protein n=1 Tax=Xenorhabdus bovienii TaxID=40576 RepID=UPI0023B299DD|nr:hypothetical protein [Xenorhabdus bovienii]
MLVSSLFDNVVGIINSYKNCQGDVSTICVYWMLSGWTELDAMNVDHENDNLEVTDRTSYKLNVVARRLTNKSAKNIASQMAHTSLG